jgi:hypothetical protein
LKNKQLYLHDNLPNDFLQDIIVGKKLGVPLSFVNFMPESIANTDKVSSEILFSTLKEYPEYAIRLPDLPFSGMKPWLLNITNSLTGGQL